MICAYDQTLLSKARTSMAGMFHYAVNVRGIELSEFYHMFLSSALAERFETGDSCTIAGKSGIELAIMILSMNHIEAEHELPIYSTNRSPEYWLGWALSYYQWVKNVKYRQITNAIDIDEILLMYKKYHELDISHFVIEMDRRRSSAYSESALKRFREYAKLSQKELADKSGVPVRTIQQYEQRQKNINNAKAETVIQLAQILYCSPADLFEWKECER